MRDSTDEEERGKGGLWARERLHGQPNQPTVWLLDGLLYRVPTWLGPPRLAQANAFRHFRLQATRTANSAWIRRATINNGPREKFSAATE